MKLIKFLNSQFIYNNYLDLGNTFFLLGIFFLPSALPIGGIFLLISIFISFNNKKKFLKNKWNFILFICMILIILGTIYSSLINPSSALLDFNKSTIWLNLFNWVPIYFAFIGFQSYLRSEKQKLLFQKFLIAGTVPVIASCIIQIFFNIYGPFETLFGTIVWFNYDLTIEQLQRATGLFNNPNYLGMWMTICLPFSITALKLEKKNFLNMLFLLIINLLIIYFAFKTYSRNALIGILISFLFLIDKKKLIYFTILFFLSFFIFIYLLPNFLNISPLESINLSQFRTLEKLTSVNLNLNQPRIAIWSNAIKFISMRPMLGWGPGSFPNVFLENAYLKIPLTQYQHTHNLIIELAYNFGIPIAILISTTVINLFVKAFNKIKKINKSSQYYFLSQPVLTSFSIFFVAHITDITYYDGKISIMFALLLASLKNIIDENIEIKNNEKYLLKAK